MGDYKYKAFLCYLAKPCIKKKKKAVEGGGWVEGEGREKEEKEEEEKKEERQAFCMAGIMIGTLHRFLKLLVMLQ